MKENLKSFAEKGIDSLEGLLKSMFHSMKTKESIQSLFNKLREMIGVKTKKELEDLKHEVASESKEATSNGVEENTILFGDSIGVGFSTASRKYGKLFEKYVKSGASSDKVHSFLKKFEGELNGKSLVFMSGFNDLPAGRKGADRALRNMKKNIALAKKRGGEPVVCGLYETNYFRINNEDVDYYNAELQKICKQEGVKFVDLKTQLAGQNLPDGLHLDAKGYDLAWERIRKELSPGKTENYV